MRLFRWLRPGMVATIVATVLCFLLVRFAYPFAMATRTPGGLLTALGYSPAGSFKGWNGPTSTMLPGFVRTEYVSFGGSQLPEWLPASEAPQTLGTLPRYDAGIIADHLGFPVPWLVNSWYWVLPSPDGVTFTAEPPQTYRVALGGFPFRDPHTPRLVNGVLTDPRAPISSILAYHLLCYYPDPLGFLLNTLVFSSAWSWLKSRRARRRCARNHCAGCNYARAGLSPDTACPECGQKPVH